MKILVDTFWGITYKSIRSIISSSKLAVIYCNPEVSLFLLHVQKLPCFAIQTLKIVHHSSEFLPYVIFLSPPSTACIKQLDSNLLSSVSVVPKKILSYYIRLYSSLFITHKCKQAIFSFFLNLFAIKFQSLFRKSFCKIRQRKVEEFGRSTNNILTQKQLWMIWRTPSGL